MKSAISKWGGYFLAALFLASSFQLTAAPSSDKKTADLKARFEQGIMLLSQRKFADARAIFDKNIAEDPKALGSLLYAGIASNELYEPKKALDYFERYRTFNSSDERLKLGMLRAYQSLKMSKEAEALVSEIRDMKKTGLGKYLPMMTDFERERIQQPAGKAISVLEVFDQQPARPVWKYLLIDADMKPLRLVEIVEASKEATAKAKAVDPKIGDKSVYLLQEVSIALQQTGGYKIFKTMVGLPSYEDSCALALDAFAGKLPVLVEKGM